MMGYYLHMYFLEFNSDACGTIQAIICGTVGQAPVQKILRNGRNVTVFTVGTGGMFDQRTVMEKGLPKPAQWHRIAVHNDTLGTYAVQKIVKKYISMSSVLLYFLQSTKRNMLKFLAIVFLTFEG